MEGPDRHAGSWPRRAAWGVVLGGVGVFAAAVPVRAGSHAQVPWLDVGVYTAVYVAAGLLLVGQRAASPWARWGWRFVGAALFVNSAGNVCFSLIVERAPEPVYPSVADYLYLSWYVLAYVGILMLLRSRVPRLTPGVALDAVIAGLGGAAVALALLLGNVVTIAGATKAQIVVNLAYPVADLLLIFMVIAGISLMGRGMGLVMGFLGAGLGVEAVADAVFLMQDTTGAYVEGGWVDLLWLLGVAGIAAASEAGRRAPSTAGCRSGTAPAGAPGAVPAGAPGAAPDGRGSFGGVFLPVTASLAGAVLIGAHQAGRGPGAAVAVADACVLAALARAALSFREARLAREREVAVLHRQARTDDLTGLPNRRALDERCEALLATAGEHPVCLLLLDLDRFKEINDALGHAAGDQLLTEVAERLRGALPPSDELARLGGDEFAVLVPGGAEAGRGHGELVLGALAEPFVLAGTRVHVEGSIGIACAPDHAAARGELLRFADAAMYEAKRTRSRIGVYACGPGASGRERLRTVEELRGALAGEDPRRNGYLVVHLQPQLTLGDHPVVVGTEALVRWQHPVRGLLLPGDFLPLARGAGLFDGLVEVVLDLALGACHRWWQAGWRVPVAVNVSASDLHDPALVERTGEALARHELPGRALVVEVTEETLMVDPAGAHGVLERLRALGPRVSIDDFGSGYSSFAYLGSLPADELKLDALFVRDLARDPAERSRPAAIVRTVADLAHSLGLRLVAEGIEDQAVAVLLRRLGVDIGQGFHLARPMPADQMIAWLRERPVADPFSPAGPGTTVAG